MDSRYETRFGTEYDAKAVGTYLRRILMLASLCIFFLTASLNISAVGRERGMIEIGGGKIAYELAGKGSNLVLIHGGLADSRVWDDQFEEFAKSFRVLRYDLRGYGKSDFPAKEFSHIDDLNSILSAFKMNKASLVGLSIGGVIAADFAIQNPEKVEKLVLTAAGLRGDTSPTDEKTIAVYEAAGAKGMDAAIELWLEHPLFASGRGNAAFASRSRQMLADNFRYWGPSPKPVPVSWPKWLTSERLGEISAPTLIIVGDKDAAYVISIASTLSKKIKDAESVTIPDVSHHLTMEVPKKYNKAVLTFLRKRYVKRIDASPVKPKV